MILDNRDNGRVLDALDEAIHAGAKIHLMTRRLSIFGFEALKHKLEQLEKVRLLFSQQEMFPDVNQEQHPLLGEREDRPLRNRLTTPAIARDFDAWLQEKVELRASFNPLNANQFGVSNDDGTEYVLTGSSTFTSTGLGVVPSDGHEMNTLFSATRDGETTDSNIGSLQTWFAQIWQNTTADPHLKKQLSELLKLMYTPRPPQQLYFQTLFHLFRDSLHLVDEDKVIKSRTGIKETRVWKALYKFQKDGVISAISKMEQYNGCIIADSVGLGKTFEALAVIKYYELRNDRVLVLAPKKLRDNWALFTLNDKRNLFAEDRFNYDVLNHTDLTRDVGYSGDINLSMVNWGTYDLVVIDESHNFRNNPKRKEGSTRYSRLMEDIIRSGVKTKVLMLSATPVNNRMNDLKNQVAFITEGQDDALYEAGIHSIEQTLKRAQTKFSQWQLREDVERTTDSLLNTLNFDYFRLLDVLTIARSRKHITKYFDSEDIGSFPERLRPVNRKPDIDLQEGFPPLRELNREIRRLNLAAYAPLKYLLNEKREEYAAKYDTEVRQGSSVFRQVDREQSLIHLMRVNLLKRLESSVVSFALTLGKSHQKVTDLLEKIEYTDSIDELSIEDVDLEDEAMQPFLIGTKIKVLIQDMDLVRWKQELLEDQQRLLKLYRIARAVSPEQDAKLQELRDLLLQKTSEPINDGNHKALVFIAFADTASYLYRYIADWALEVLGLHSALVTGGPAGNSTNLPGSRSDFNTILTNFSPQSKERARLEVDAEHAPQIDILIATDCISEGQNLQDCDLVVNYDIHWNPVRIIQRFGRIDRLGSKNARIKLVNFWPNLELDEYINLEARVSGRMVLLDISATGEENVIEYADSATMNDLEYRRRQMEQLQDEVVDLEELGSGVSITDLTLNDYRMDLAEYMKDYPEELSKLPPGGRAFVIPDSAAEQVSEPGVLFCLKAENPDISIDPNYAVAPFYLVFVGADGEVRQAFTQTRQLLQRFKMLTLGHTRSAEAAVQAFDTRTSGGRNMATYQHLLKIAVQSVSGKAEEKGVESLFSRGGTNAGRQRFKGVDDFEVLSYLIVAPEAIGQVGETR